MKKERLIIILLVFIAFTMFSCDKEDLFDQPSIEVTGYSLRELPGLRVVNRLTHSSQSARR